MKIKPGILLLTVILVFCFSSACFAQTFSDMCEATYGNEITELTNRGIIHGDANGAFRPKDNITRAEFAKLVCMISEDYENFEFDSNIFAETSPMIIGLNLISTTVFFKK